MTALLPVTQRALLHDVATVQADDRQPSVVAGVVRDGALVWSAARGELGEAVGDPAGLQYRIGSLTKTFTAVLVLQCRDDGLLDLDDQVGTHLPGSPYPATTLRQLLAHAGGVPAEPDGPWWERHEGGSLDDLVARLARQPQVLSAGAQHHYSNVGYALLGAVVARLRGGTWWQVLSERVLTPLGMSRTTYGPEHPHAQGWSVHPWSGRLARGAAHRHRGDGTSRPAVEHRRRPGPVGGVPARPGSRGARAGDARADAGADRLPPGRLGRLVRARAAARDQRGRAAARARRLDARLPRRHHGRPGRARRRGDAGQRHDRRHGVARDDAAGHAARRRAGTAHGVGARAGAAGRGRAARTSGSGATRPTTSPCGRACCT